MLKYIKYIKYFPKFPKMSSYKSVRKKLAKDMNKPFTETEISIQMALRYMKRCSISFIREIQIKTAPRYNI